MRTAATAPTARQVLERGRENAPEHLLPATLYQTAAKELAKLHKVFLYHGYVRLSNFKVDEATGAVNLINYQFCGDSLAGIYDDISAQILASEKKKLFNLFSDYMTEEEINEVKIE